MALTIWEYCVWTTEVRHIFSTKRAALRHAAALMSMGKIVTIQQLRVYYRAPEED
jgi:hypothetical protein